MGNHLFLRLQPGSPSAVVQSVGKQDTVPRKSHTVPHTQKVLYSGTPQMAGRSFHFVTIHAKKEKKNPLCAFCAFSERTREDKAGCQQTVELPRVRAPAANVDICMYFAFSQYWKKKGIKKHIASFIFHTACNDINKLQNADKLFGVFFMKRMPCFLCQLQLCTSACQHLGQDKPYAHVTASSLVTWDVWGRQRRYATEEQYSERSHLRAGRRLRAPPPPSSQELFVFLTSSVCCCTSSEHLDVLWWCDLCGLVAR